MVYGRSEGIKNVNKDIKRNTKGIISVKGNEMKRNPTNGIEVTARSDYLSMVKEMSLRM